jgi:hypothetical protein
MIGHIALAPSRVIRANGARTSVVRFVRIEFERAQRFTQVAGKVLTP